MESPNNHEIDMAVRQRQLKENIRLPIVSSIRRGYHNTYICNRCHQQRIKKYGKLYWYETVYETYGEYFICQVCIQDGWTNE